MDTTTIEYKFDLFDFEILHKCIIILYTLTHALGQNHGYYMIKKIVRS